jgi:hypothetical protein
MNPTCEQLWNEELEMVASEADPSWRHGCIMTQVFRRDDETFWEAVYARSADNETNGLREDIATIRQVYPHPVLITVYRATPYIPEG